MTMPETDSAPATYVGMVTFGGEMSMNEAAIRHPISAAAAQAEAFRFVGMTSARFFLKRRQVWWDRLRAASTPEEKLTCERMITAYTLANGLHDHERGREIATENAKASEDRSRVEAEQRAIDRWRK